MQMKRQEIQIRDPFILPVADEGIYYMYSAADTNTWEGKATGFNVYVSKDLEDWEGPHPVFRPDSDFWADRNFWAPEVHEYQGRYYMFASFKAEGVNRGTQVLAADHPMGPFMPYSDGPVTPRAWECLDGTLFVDDGGDPWIVFCHEWVQVFDGEMHAMKLTRDLSAPASEPHLLFHASAAPWVRPFSSVPEKYDRACYITDGPFLYRAGNGVLLMLWSSFGEQGYAIGVARSASGSILGPWEHESEALFKKDGGHGMLFKTHDHRLLLTIHTPNRTPEERPVFFTAEETEGRLVLKPTSKV